MIGALVTFVFGVYLNELILGIQGIASFSYTSIPFANQALFVASVIIFLSVFLLLISQWSKSGVFIATKAEEKNVSD